MAFDELGNIILDENRNPTPITFDEGAGTAPTGGVLSPPVDDYTLNGVGLDIEGAADKTQLDIEGADSSIDPVTYGGAGYYDDSGEYVPAGAITQKESAIRGAEEFYDYDKGSVAGLMGQYMDPESELMQRAATLNRLKQQRSGMLGASMAAGSERKAMVGEARKVAELDAAAYQRLSEEEQRQYGEAGKLGAEGIVSVDLKTVNAELANQQTQFNAALEVMTKEFDYKAGAVSQKFMTDTQADHELAIGTALTELEGSIQTALNNQTITADQAAAVKTQASAYLQNHQIAIETLMSNESFTSLGADAMAATFNNLKALTTGAIEFAGAAVSYDYTGWTDQLASDLTFTVTGDVEPGEVVGPDGYAPTMDPIDDAGNFSIALPDLDISNIASATINWGDRKSTEVEDLETLKTGVDYTYQSGLEGLNAIVSYTMTNGEVVRTVFPTSGAETTNTYVQDPDTGEWSFG